MQDKIEKKEIKEFIYYLHSIGKILSSKAECDIKLPKSEFFLLAFLIKQKKEKNIDSVLPSTISEKTKLSRPAVTQTLNSLEKKGYVVRIMDEKDRRKFKVEITSKGKKMFNDTFESKFSELMDIIEKLGKEKVNQLTDIFKEIVEISKNNQKGNDL